MNMGKRGIEKVTRKTYRGNAKNKVLTLDDLGHLWDEGK
jgi:hypothetical protein